MSGRIRTGIYVLGLVRIRYAANIGDATQLALRWGACPTNLRRRRGTWPHRRVQSPSCFRSRR